MESKIVAPLPSSAPAGSVGYQKCVNRQAQKTTSAAYLSYPGARPPAAATVTPTPSPIPTPTPTPTPAAAPAPPAAPPAPVVTPQMLAERASVDLKLGLPEPQTSPGLGHFQLAGLPTWFWLTGWDRVSQTASIPGLSATVSAKPMRTTWDFGPAGTLVCDGPGTPYDTGLPADAQSTTCAKTFIEAGAYPSRVTVDWSLSWSASTGQGGDLPGVARTTTFDLDVRAAQAVTD